MREVKDFELESQQAAPIIRHYYSCSLCDGTGQIDATKQEFKQYMWNMFCGADMILRDALAIMRDWRKTGKLECQKCNGRGRLEEKF